MEDENRAVTFLDTVISIDENMDLQHNHYVKPTSSNTYLHYTSHSPMSTKINIIRTDAARVIRNCSKLSFIYGHLENLKEAFIKSGYPSNLIDRILVPELQKAELGHFGHKSIMQRQKEKERKDEKEKDEPKKDEFILKIPYVNEFYTRKMKAGVKNNKINAKVVVKSGLNLRSKLIPTNVQECNCIGCSMNIPCNIRNYIYKAQCLHCPEFYIGASHRPGKERINEYESSVRLPHQAKCTTLGRHKFENHFDQKNELKTCYNFSIIDKGKDSLELFQHCLYIYPLIDCGTNRNALIEAQHG